MTQISKNANTLQGLQMAIDVMKSLASQANLRAKHAEEIANAITEAKVPKWMQEELGRLLQKHMNERAFERTVHQQALIQNAELSLNVALQGPQENLKEAVQTILKEIVRFQSTMNELPPAKIKE